MTDDTNDNNPLAAMAGEIFQITDETIPEVFGAPEVSGHYSLVDSGNLQALVHKVFEKMNLLHLSPQASGASHAQPASMNQHDAPVDAQDGGDNSLLDECLDFLLRIVRGQEDCVASHNIDDAETTLRRALSQQALFICGHGEEIAPGVYRTLQVCTAHGSDDVRTYRLDEPAEPVDLGPRHAMALSMEAGHIEGAKPIACAGEVDIEEINRQVVYKFGQGHHEVIRWLAKAGRLR
jgi:hypothetical protein